MKVVLTLLLVVFFGTFAVAQDVKEDTTTVTEITIVTTPTTNDIKTSTTNKMEVAPVKENSVARLYRHKNARIKKALKFTTKRNRAKLA